MRHNSPTPLTNMTRKSVGLSPMPSGTLLDVDRLPQMDIIHLESKVNHLTASLADFREDLDQVETIKAKEFLESDAYEVKKRMERLELKLSSLQSDMRLWKEGFNKFDNRLALLSVAHILIYLAFIIFMLYWR